MSGRTFSEYISLVTLLLFLSLGTVGCGDDDDFLPIPGGPTSTPTVTATPMPTARIVAIAPGGNDQDNLLTALIEP